MMAGAIALRAGAFLFLQIIAAVLVFSLLVMVSFGLRDAFCYPYYVRDLTVGVFGIILIAIIALTPGALIAGWALGEMRRRWSFVMLPHTLAVLSLLGLYGSDVTMRLANDAHCAAGRPEVQDNTAQTTLLSEILAYLAAVSAFGAFLACIVIVLRMVVVAPADDRP